MATTNHGPTLLELRPRPETRTLSRPISAARAAARSTPAWPASCCSAPAPRAPGRRHLEAKKADRPATGSEMPCCWIAGTATACAIARPRLVACSRAGRVHLVDGTSRPGRPAGLHQGARCRAAGSSALRPRARSLGRTWWLQPRRDRRRPSRPAAAAPAPRTPGRRHLEASKRKLFM